MALRVSNSSTVIPIRAIFSRFSASIASFVRSRMRALVSSEWPIPLFHGRFPVLAAEILARLSAVCGRPGTREEGAREEGSVVREEGSVSVSAMEKRGRGLWL